MEAIIKACENDDINAKVTAVISNKSNAKGLEIARSFDIPTHVIDHKEFHSRDMFDKTLSDLINQYNPDLICLAGFMRILGNTYFENVAITTLNIHPSLLPKYKGLKTHEAVLEAGDDIHGATVHKVTPELDDGDIIAQAQIAVEKNDTPDSLATRLLPIEHQLYIEAIRKVLTS